MLGRISRFPTVDLLKRPDETHPRRGRVSRFGMSAVAALMNALSKGLFPDPAAGWAGLGRFQLAGRRLQIDRTSFCRFVRYEFQEAGGGGVEDFSVEPRLLLNLLSWLIN